MLTNFLLARVLMTLTSLKYRPDIDGLRTLAVLPVILFHAGATWLPGGFVGVDIFFVISGYLISTIILRDVQAGEFSFLRFYERRLRRIIPALLVMLLVTVAVFQVIALPDQAQGAAESGIAAILSLSNFYFWRQSGYFAPTAEFMPLLHTWSLAVEEQFYLIFPVILLAVWKLRLPVNWVILIGTVLAFATGLWLSINKPSVAYYLLPARAWELALGAVIAAGVVPQVGRGLREVVPALGVGMILFAIFWIRSDMIFPGWVAIIPCLGAAMVIHSSGQSWVARRILSSRPMVFVGLLSYSLYLWHWPILVALRIRTANADLDLLVAAGAVLLTFVLAWLSWRYVEQPFRDRTAMPAKRMLSLLGGLAAAVAGLAFLSITMAGFPSRLSERGQTLIAGALDTDHYSICPEGSLDQACRFGNDNEPLRILVVGDSQTPPLYRALDAFAAKTGRGVIYWHSACPLLDGAWREGDGYRTACFAFRERVFHQIETLPDLEVVILVGSWQGQLGNMDTESRYPLMDRESVARTPQEADRAFSRSLGRTLTRFGDLGLGTIILGSSPGAGFDVPRIMALAELNGIARPVGSNVAYVRPIQDRIDALLTSVAGTHQNVVYVPIWDIFCPAAACSLTFGDVPIYSDGGHLSGSGATDFLGPVLQERLHAGMEVIGVNW